MVHLKTTTVTTVHSNAEIDRIDQSKRVRRLFVFLENYCLKRTDCIIVVAKAIQELLIARKIPENKIHIIENGIPYIEYPEKIFSSDQLKLCCVGRLEKVKGISSLLKALSRLSHINYACDIYGDGSLRTELLALSKELGLDDKVCFKGFDPDIRSKLFEYDVLIQPSLYEASPLTLFEAMNARTLIVCSDAGGMRDIIQDGINGFKFPVNDCAKLADIITNVDSNRNLLTCLTENAYHSLIERYTESIMFHKTSALLKSLTEFAE